MKDILLSKLIKEAGLTETQVETILLRRRVLSGDITSSQAISLRSRPVKIGSYHRVLKQARINLEQAIFSLLIAARLGAIKPAEFERLLSIVSASPSDIDEGRAVQVTSVLSDIIRNIVML